MTKTKSNPVPLEVTASVDRSTMCNRLSFTQSWQTRRESTGIIEVDKTLLEVSGEVVESRHTRRKRIPGLRSKK
jgi:hypothetical protein